MEFTRARVHIPNLRETLEPLADFPRIYVVCRKKGLGGVFFGLARFTLLALAQQFGALEGYCIKASFEIELQYLFQWSTDLSAQSIVWTMLLHLLVNSLFFCTNYRLLTTWIKHRTTYAET